MVKVDKMNSLREISRELQMSHELVQIILKSRNTEHLNTSDINICMLQSVSITIPILEKLQPSI